MRVMGRGSSLRTGGARGMRGRVTRGMRGRRGRTRGRRNREGNTVVWGG